MPRSSVPSHRTRSTITSTFTTGHTRTVHSAGRCSGTGRAAIALATDLSGDRERPVLGDPGGSGFAALVFAYDRVAYYLWTKDINPPTAAHIHQGVGGEGGPVSVAFDPTFVSGVAVGSVSIDSSLAAEIRAHPDRFYVNVHNDDFPGGALRGQLAATETVLHLPIVARNPGVGTSNYVSDARVQNLNDLDATVWVEWYPATTSGRSGPVATVPLAVVGGGEAVVNDVVGTLFGGTSKGSLRLLAPTPFRAVANTYNDQRPSGRGTFGQFEEALPLDRAFPAGTLPFNSHLPKAVATGWRTNLGYFNPSPDAVDVTFGVHRPDGSSIANQALTFPGFASDIRAYHEILTAVPAAEQSQPDFFISYSANREVFIYSSMVDNVSDDGFHQPALAAPAFVMVPPTPLPTPSPTPTPPGPAPTATPSPTPTVPGPTSTPTPTIPGPTPTPTTPAPTPTPTTPAPTPTPTRRADAHADHARADAHADHAGADAHADHAGGTCPVGGPGSYLHASLRRLPRGLGPGGGIEPVGGPGALEPRQCRGHHAYRHPRGSLPARQQRAGDLPGEWTPQSAGGRPADDLGLDYRWSAEQLGTAGESTMARGATDLACLSGLRMN